MTANPEEAIQPEVEGSLSGPANPIPDQLIDCGCKQLPCPKLASFATRRLFVGLLSWIGLVQAAAHAYLHIVAPTIARRYQFDPYLVEWVLVISDLTPFFLGILVAYWGNRIHRAAWIGGVVLLQSVSYFIMIIPHLTHQTKVVEETENSTHLSIYADDSRELCNVASSRIVATENEYCYFTLAVMIAMQIISGVANITYFTLGISYLDDNTKKIHVAPFIAALVAAKVMGVLLGFILAWGCLSIDAMDLTAIESYKEQIGAWWLGLPILTILLVVPGLLLSWFPGMLLSQAVEQGAASLLNGSSSYDQISLNEIRSKGSDSRFWPSLARLVANKTLICQVLACTLYMTAIINFMAFENLIAESRFHVPKPTGMLRGLGDPSLSRLITNILKPVLVSLIVIISGFVITKATPTARGIVGYSAVATLIALGIIFTLSAARCINNPIVGIRKNSLEQLQYCNMHCGCSNDANFRPVCDSGGEYTFYSPCHAGCTFSDVKNGMTIYSNCKCVESMTGNDEATDGSCNLYGCQLSWLAFEFGILLTYMLIASTLVGDLLLILRSVNAQDKAIGIGFWMTCVALVANVPGKIIYDVIASLTCQYWGSQGAMCRLHDGLHLGNYLCYLTGSLLGLCVLLRIIVWFFCEDVDLYAEKEVKTRTDPEMQDLFRILPAASSEQTQQPQQTNDGQNNETAVQVEVTNDPTRNQARTSNEDPEDEQDANDTEDAPLKYGPLGPGNRRTDSKASLDKARTSTPRIGNLDSEDDLSSSDEESKKDSSPKVAYRPLDIDSDVESDLSSMEPRSRRRVSSKEYDPTFSIDVRSPFRREFPNPDNYDDPRLSRRWTPSLQGPQVDGFLRTDSFEYSNSRDEDTFQKKGDFNEVGIPLVYPVKSPTRSIKPWIKPYGANGNQQAGRPMTPRRASPRGQNSPGIGNFNGRKVIEERPESRESVNSPKTSSKGSLGTLQTDF